MDTLVIITGVLAALVTALIGFQLYNVIYLEKRVNKKVAEVEKRLIQKISQEVEKINQDIEKSVAYSEANLLSVGVAMFSGLEDYSNSVRMSFEVLSLYDKASKKEEIIDCLENIKDDVVSLKQADKKVELESVDHEKGLKVLMKIKEQYNVDFNIKEFIDVVIIKEQKEGDKITE